MTDETRDSCEPTTADAALIRRFAASTDQDAFAALLTRHGPLVMGVCRRLLHNQHHAEDAFQATFLVLAQKAGKVRWQRSLANWLHRVAFGVCLNARIRMYRVPELVSAGWESEELVELLTKMFDEVDDETVVGKEDQLIVRATVETHQQIEQVLNELQARE